MQLVTQSNIEFYTDCPTVDNNFSVPEYDPEYDETSLKLSWPTDSKLNIIHRLHVCMTYEKSL